MIETLPDDWRTALAGRLQSLDLDVLDDFVSGERQAHDVFPSAGREFEALRLTPFESVRAVILGQDPYPTKELACGLAFSVPPDLPPDVRRPHSLNCILAELRRDHFTAPMDATLEPWAANGVLLLNTALTVRAGDAGSHRDAWAPFTNAALTTLARRPEPPGPIVFLLWGNHAKGYVDVVGCDRAVLSPHPASRGKGGHFKDSRPFSRANAELCRLGIDPIDWKLDPLA